MPSARWPRASRIERVAIALVIVVMAILVILEPDILRAPFQNLRTIGFTFGGAVAALLVWLALVRCKVPAVLRIVALGVPFVVVSVWLLEPYFVDDVVNDEFDVTIADAPRASTAPPLTPPPVTLPTDATVSTPTAPAATTPDATVLATEATPAPLPVLLGTGSFAGLAGHRGSGDAGFFRQADGSHVLRFENFDIQNGPDLRLYVVPGADRLSPGDDALYLGELRGNVGDQTYDLPAGYAPAGDLTVLVWCEAFSVEFVAATVAIG